MPFVSHCVHCKPNYTNFSLISGVAWYFNTEILVVRANKQNILSTAVLYFYIIHCLVSSNSQSIVNFDSERCELDSWQMKEFITYRTYVD